MRLGLIGDVHAEDELLRVALNALRAEAVDRVLCTGDIVDGLGDVDRCCDLLREAGAVIVRGNHDRWIRADEMRRLPHAHKMTDLSVETITLLKGLPPIVSMEIAPLGCEKEQAKTKARLLLCHGVGTNDMCRLGPDDYGYAISSNEDLLALLFDASVHVMVGGHTHHPMVRRFERQSDTPPLFVVNAGTLAREHKPGFGILDLHTRRVDFFGIVGNAGDANHLQIAPSSSTSLRIK